MKQTMLEFLTAALEEGQNILLAGTYQNCLAVAKNLLQYRKCSFIGEEKDLPLRWQKNDSAFLRSDHHLVSFSLDYCTLTPMLLNNCGAVVWVPAASTAQALMRFEIGCHYEESPLIVPAAFNLVALANGNGVCEINRLEVAEPAYKPVQLNFSEDSTENSAAACQTSADEAISQQAYQEEALLAASGEEALAATFAGYSMPDNLEDDEEDEEDYSAEDLPIDDERANQDFDPGWELDMLLANGAVKTQDTSTSDAEASNMAATYRLGPPPKPLSMADAERAAQPGSVVLPPPAITPSTQAVIDSFERKFGPPPSQQTNTRPVNNNQPRSFQQVFAQKQNRK